MTRFDNGLGLRVLVCVLCRERVGGRGLERVGLSLGLGIKFNPPTGACARAEVRNTFARATRARELH